MIWVALYAQRRQCLECTGEEKLFIPLVLHEDFSCLKDAVVEVDVVDLKVANNLSVKRPTHTS